MDSDKHLTADRLREKIAKTKTMLHISKKSSTNSEMDIKFLGLEAFRIGDMVMVETLKALTESLQKEVKQLEKRYQEL